MALPTTNLTFHANASVNTDVWVNYQGSPPYHNTNAADGNRINIWDDVEHTGYTLYGVNIGPYYKTATPLMPFSCLYFDGADWLKPMDDPGAAFTAASTFLGVGAKTAIFAIYVESITSNAANAYDNQGVICDESGGFGIHLRNAGGGAYKVIAYNYDGTQDTVELPISLNTTTIVTVRHDGTNLYISKDGGTESSVASGNNSGLPYPLRVGINWNNTANFVGRIGEFALWNAALTGTDLSDANSYFTSKWLPSSGTTYDVAVAEGTASAADTPTADLVLAATVAEGSATAADATDAALVAFAFPIADITVGGWTPSSGSDLYPMLDESAVDFADYIYSPSNPSGEQFEIKLGNI